MIFLFVVFFIWMGVLERVMFLVWILLLFFRRGGEFELSRLKMFFLKICVLKDVSIRIKVYINNNKFNRCVYFNKRYMYEKFGWVFGCFCFCKYIFYYLWYNIIISFIFIVISIYGICFIWISFLIIINKNIIKLMK